MSRLSLLKEAERQGADTSVYKLDAQTASLGRREAIVEITALEGDMVTKCEIKKVGPYSIVNGTFVIVFPKFLAPAVLNVGSQCVVVIHPEPINIVANRVLVSYARAV